ncbi:hypothetical protein [Streptomyces caniferus]|uniref:hypothetical protein n=1 Tax=Streptomyces caniferus TaxID=285557 RepID=UPI00381D4D49
MNPINLRASASTSNAVTYADTEQPTAAAYVKITTSASGPAFMASVPGKETGTMLKTVVVGFGVTGAVLSPIAMAKALDVVGVGMPWQARAGCLVVAALLPVFCFWLARRRK